ncbi:type II secretion system protein GspH [Colwellia sp. MT41]|uniref:Type II secretion system protein H n=1 Tax=Colwellia marinimaniae TaxID=1513592 RepID=A0ABQ0MXH2_9GAMM|nr:MULTISPECIES: type II secretion system minor pseudopilin GspH [Colwellia]ALO36083.1 type II secretion system protein GspH [Colwellia sp. MT41]GAW97068.1 type II secretion system protein GspH [Colwellia marinimaniae]
MKFKHSNSSYSAEKHRGFTLIEVMVVIVLIGLMASLVQFNFSGNNPADKLKHESARFAAIFAVAADYGMLNNIELGLVVKKDSYQFLGYDGTRWTEIPEQDWLANVTLPEGIELSLELDDLPIDEPLLFDADTFREKDEDDFTLLSKEEQEEKIIPQVYILSGGDISPFSVTFRLNEELAYIVGAEDLAYRVTGIYSVPLTIEGPVLDEQ